MPEPSPNTLEKLKEFAKYVTGQDSRFVPAWSDPPNPPEYPEQVSKPAFYRDSYPEPKRVPFDLDSREITSNNPMIREAILKLMKSTEGKESPFNREFEVTYEKGGPAPQKPPEQKPMAPPPKQSMDQEMLHQALLAVQEKERQRIASEKARLTSGN